MNKKELIEFNNKLLYKPPNKIIFADDTASGRPCKFIDKQITKMILPYYSNTHSNAFCGIYMKNLLNETRKYIRQEFNLKPFHKIFFSGNGCTGAINHLANSIDYKLYKKVNIYITKYEHYSNQLPWNEQANLYNNTKVIIFEDSNDIKLETGTDILNIFTINGCSNVTGCVYDLTNIKRLRKGKLNTYLLVDYACSAPYIKINLDDLDGVYISMHKFLGGHSTPGLLIANEKLFQKKNPYTCGGGCVKKSNSTEIIYETDLEKKESAGTPNIVGIIKILYILKLKNKLMNTILHNEHIISEYVYERFKTFKHKYNIIVIGGTNCVQRLPIVSFAIYGAHYNFIVVLLNDLFGIQSRGGLSCCGLLSEYIKEKYNIDGWCRITFNYMMDYKTIDYILNSVEFVIKNHKKYTNLYIYDKKDNLYIAK
jgi:selenocysteine lyase/cysteine desulfurase